jgi:hypothetical protein
MGLYEHLWRHGEWDPDIENYVLANFFQTHSCPWHWMPAGCQDQTGRLSSKHKIGSPISFGYQMTTPRMAAGCD